MTITARTAGEVPRDSLRRTARDRGLALPDHVHHLDPRPHPLRPRLDSNYILGSGSTGGVQLGSRPRRALCARRHRHRRRAVPGRQAAERGRRARLSSVSRILEASALFVGVVSLLSIVTLRQDLAGATGADAAALSTTGDALVAIHNWAYLVGPGILSAVNALLLGSLMYRSGLVPRVIPMIGLIGAPLLIASGIATMFGAFDQFSAMAGIAGLPGGAVGALGRQLDGVQGLQAVTHHRAERPSRPYGGRAHVCLTRPLPHLPRRPWRSDDHADGTGGLPRPPGGRLPEQHNRVTTLFRIILVIPIAIVISVLTAGATRTVYNHGGKAVSTYKRRHRHRPVRRHPADDPLQEALPALVVRLRPGARSVRHRVWAYLALLTDEYPSTVEEQNVHLDLDYPDVEEDLNRWLPLVKWLLAIPHFIILIVLSVAAFFAVVIAWFAILFTGRYPRGLFDFVVGVGRWWLRVEAYAMLLVTDRYPPFSLA